MPLPIILDIAGALLTLSAQALRLAEKLKR
jgi:hypothetical protein